MKNILMAFNPKSAKLIVDGKKTVEIRRKFPMLKNPVRIFVYVTKHGYDEFLRKSVDTDEKKQWKNYCGKVIGEFICNEVSEISGMNYPSEKKSQLSHNEIMRYLLDKNGYALKISDFKLYDVPFEITELYKNDTLSYPDFLYTVYRGISIEKELASYLETKRMTRAPQSWCYVKEL